MTFCTAAQHSGGECRLGLSNTSKDVISLFPMYEKEKGQGGITHHDPFGPSRGKKDEKSDQPSPAKSRKDLRWNNFDHVLSFACFCGGHSFAGEKGEWFWP